MIEKIREFFGQEPHTFDIRIPFRIKGRRWYIPEFNPLWWAVYIIGAGIGFAIIYIYMVSMILIGQVVGG